MADSTDQGELSRQLLAAIAQHVVATTNYWGEFEQLDADSMVKAADACEKIVFSWKPEQFQAEQTMDICINFAAWMQHEGLAGNWKENYIYFLNNIYKYQPASQSLNQNGTGTQLPDRENASPSI